MVRNVSVPDLSWLRLIKSNLVERPALFVLAFMLIYGFRHEDLSDFATLTSDPFVTHPEPARQFLHSSPLMIFLGWPITHLLGAGFSYFIVSVAGLVVLICATIAYLRPMPADQRTTAMLIVFSTPILLVLTRWIGKGDPYLLAIFLLTLDRRRGNALQTSLCAALIVAHKELGTIMLVVDAIVRRRLRLATAAGLALGNALVLLYMASLSVPPMSRIEFATHMIPISINGWAHNPISHLLLAFNWFWFFLFARRNEADWPWVVVAVLLCFAISFDGADYTRDMLLCAFPIVVYTAEAIARTPSLSHFVTASTFPIAFLVQMQVESSDQVTDTSWLMRVVSYASHFLQGS